MKDTFDQLINLLGDSVKQNEPLARYTTWKVGGPAEYFFVASTKDDLVQSIRIGRSLKLPIFLLGGGTNILIGDRGIKGLVIKNNTKSITIAGMKGAFQGGKQKSTVYVEADSGVPMNHLVRTTIDQGLAGLEMQLGLPGTVGGAVYMNSKWTHPVGYVGDVVFQATILTPEDEIKTVPKVYFRFAYDFSTLQQSRDVVLSVVFSLRMSDKETLWNIANDSIRYRRTSQPQGVFTAGCTFKNITKAQAMTIGTPGHTTSAGYLVDHAGLKGAHVGDAQISVDHANFIINQGRATASDVVQLIELARKKVKQKFGVTLVEEIVRVGEF